MRKSIFYLPLSFFCLLSISFSQPLKETKKHVTITVTDEAGNPLAGASINGYGDAIFSLTDAEGRYSDTIIGYLGPAFISYPGHHTAIIEIREASEFQVMLEKRGWWYFLWRPRLRKRFRRWSSEPTQSSP